jgi:ribonuclease D
MVIGTADELESFCRAAEGSPALFVDTEFVGEGRYYRAVGAIQVGAGEVAALIDPLEVRDLSPLLRLLTDPATEKVFHSADQDLHILYRLLDRPIVPVFDTQIAAAFLGYDRQISFVKLVERVAGVRLRKAHTFTDWLRRPLSDRQIEYALEDVRHLRVIHRRLADELRDRERMDWAREEFAQLEEAARFAPPDPRQVFLRLRGVERLGGPELARARELAAWREETARRRDLPPRRICADAVLLGLAQRPRDSVDALRGMRGLSSRQIARFGPGLIEALKAAEGKPPPSVSRPAPLPPELEPTVDFLLLCLRHLAARAELSPALLATRADLIKLALDGTSAEIPLMNGWRRQAFGEALLGALRGEVTARVARDSHEVSIDWPHPACDGTDDAAETDLP